MSEASVDRTRLHVCGGGLMWLFFEKDTVVSLYEVATLSPGQGVEQGTMNQPHWGDLSAKPLSLGVPKHDAGDAVCIY